MRLIKTAATGLIALSSIALVACQKEASSPTPAATSASVYDTGKLRAVVIGEALPMVEKNGDSYDGLSFVVLDAIRDQINVPPEKGQGRRHRARGRELTQRRARQNSFLAMLTSPAVLTSAGSASAPSTTHSRSRWVASECLHQPEMTALLKA